MRAAGFAWVNVTALPSGLRIGYVWEYLLEGNVVDVDTVAKEVIELRAREFPRCEAEHDVGDVV